MQNLGDATTRSELWIELREKATLNRGPALLILDVLVTEEGNVLSVLVILRVQVGTKQLTLDHRRQNISTDGAKALCNLLGALQVLELLLQLHCLQHELVALAGAGLGLAFEAGFDRLNLLKDFVLKDANIVLYSLLKDFLSFHHSSMFLDDVLHAFQVFGVLLPHFADMPHGRRANNLSGCLEMSLDVIYNVVELRPQM
mmetsp:Transcript_62738/g.101622  ORF Transcript_62738/g.101622 Transcript_62738/m.101622 type:complete len:200 (+) Transcript_62738:87-686(+)